MIVGNDIALPVAFALLSVLFAVFANGYWFGAIGFAADDSIRLFQCHLVSWQT